ncbi:MAG: DUF2809 domain-containing protein [Acidobacteriaceae bacterium]|jgi:hypothetical protein|nr:DUF2809 domain-containing protein [Acidobacteriaceae bacterium]
MTAQGWFWIRSALGIIVLGLLSRSVTTGWIVIDKYLGDALYAAMVYALLRVVLRAGPAAAGAAVLMAAIESFQLTGIPARMLASGNGLIRVVARLLGVQFGWADLLAYAVGIGMIRAIDTLARGPRWRRRMD